MLNMTTCQINVPLADSELQALQRMAFEECRDVRGQLRYLVRQEAIRRGLLTNPDSDDTPTGDEREQKASSGDNR